MSLISLTKNRMNKSEVMSIIPPEGTLTWNPISHADVIKTIETVIEKNGIGIVDEAYSVANSGHNMFATLTLDAKLGDGAMTQIGFRNSTNKKFAVGLCSGTKVLVCDNLMFSGQFIEYRKHTSGLDQDCLDNITSKAFGDIFKQSKELYDWHQNLHNVEFDEESMKIMTFDAVKTGIIAPNRFKHFLGCYKNELELTGEENGLYEFHGAVTRMVKKHNLFTVSNRTAGLNRLCDEYITNCAA